MKTIKQAIYMESDGDSGYFYFRKDPCEAVTFELKDE